MFPQVASQRARFAVTLGRMKRLDLSGKKIGELTVLGYSHSHVQPSGQKRAIWDVRCSCGAEKKMATSQLTSGGTISCGHVGAQNRKQARLLPEQGAIKNYLFLSYFHSAKSRGIDFSLSKEQFKILVSSNCAYCGSSPSNTRKSRSASVAEYKYSGIDRKDNTAGYTIENAVSCCAICNFMKRDLSESEFLNHIEKVHCHAKKRL